MFYFFCASMHHINTKRLLSFWFVTCFETCFHASLSCLVLPSSEPRQDNIFFMCASKHIPIFHLFCASKHDIKRKLLWICWFNTCFQISFPASIFALVLPSNQPRQHNKCFTSASNRIHVLHFLLCFQAQYKQQMAFEFLVDHMFPNILATVNLLFAASKHRARTTKRSLSMCCQAHPNVPFFVCFHAPHEQPTAVAFLVPHMFPNMLPSINFLSGASKLPASTRKGII